MWDKVIECVKVYTRIASYRGKCVCLVSTAGLFILIFNVGKILEVFWLNRDVWIRTPVQQFYIDFRYVYYILLKPEFDVIFVEGNSKEYIYAVTQPPKHIFNYAYKQDLVFRLAWTLTLAALRENTFAATICAAIFVGRNRISSSIWKLYIYYIYWWRFGCLVSHSGQRRTARTTINVNIMRAQHWRSRLTRIDTIKSDSGWWWRFAVIALHRQSRAYRIFAYIMVANERPLYCVTHYTCLYYTRIYIYICWCGVVLCVYI